MPRADRRTLFAPVLALAFALVLGACGSRERAGKATSSATAPIASRTVFADELLWELGPDVRARVVAVSPMADDARYSTASGKWSADIPRLGQNPEELLALAPSLVIMASFSAPEYRAALDGKLEVLVLDAFDSFDGYLTNLARVGEAIGEVERAAELASAFKQRRAALEAERPHEGKRPTVASWGHGYVAGLHTTFDDAARTAGFVNLPAREGVEGHARVDVEQLVVWEPQWLVIGCGERTCKEAVDELQQLPGLSALDAVIEDRVIAIEAPYLSTTGAAMLELSARMQARLLGAEDP